MVDGRLTIWIISPPGNNAVHSFDEVAESLHYAYREKGLHVPVVHDPSQIQGTAIVLGAILATRYPDIEIPPDSIIYNLEQIFIGSPWLTERYLELLRKHRVWDYSQRNIDMLRQLGIHDITLCRIGYVPELTRIPSDPDKEDIDVLHYGSMNERRRDVLEELMRRGLEVRHLYDVYGPERDALIARAKIVLNIHYYPAQVFEIVRCSYLLANRRFVISETGDDPDLELPFRGGIVFVPYYKLADTCQNYLDRSRIRHGVAEKGFALIKQMPVGV